MVSDLVVSFLFALYNCLSRNKSSGFVLWHPFLQLDYGQTGSTIKPQGLYSICVWPSNWVIESNRFGLMNSSSFFKNRHCFSPRPHIELYRVWYVSLLFIVVWQWFWATILDQELIFLSYKQRRQFWLCCTPKACSWNSKQSNRWRPDSCGCTRKQWTNVKQCDK